jgi:hypothetical protein
MGKAEGGGENLADLLNRTQEATRALNDKTAEVLEQAKELDRFFVGAEMEAEFSELAGRRVQATERGGRAARDPRFPSRGRSRYPLTLRGMGALYGRSPSSEADLPGDVPPH